MKNEVALTDLLWHSFLYGLVLVPLGLFLGGITCLGLISGSHTSQVMGVFAVASVFVCLIGSVYLSFRLGFEKARKKAEGGMLTPGKPDRPV